MYVDAGRVKSGVIAFMDKCVMPKLDSGKQFVAGFALSLVGQKAEAVVRSLDNVPTIKALGLVDNGNVEVDMLYNAALEQIRKQGRVTVDIPIIGTFAFDENDLNVLIQSIKG